MHKIDLNEILDIVNREKIRKGLKNYVACYPMMRVEDNKLYIGVLLVNSSDNVWDEAQKIKGCYWCLVDINTLEILEFNNISNKSYILGDIENKNIGKSQKELSIYEVKKIEEYTNYLLNDIKNDNLPIQKKLSSILGNKINIDGELVNINDYIMANIYEEVKEKVVELVDIVLKSKYSNLTFYYDELFNKIIEEYVNTDNINYELINDCIEIMDNYYPGMVGIRNFFNI